MIDLYLDDLERIVSLAKVHESVNRRFGNSPLCSLNAFDASGNRLGTIEQDQQGKTCFRIIDQKRTSRQ